jgi:hypothetical protein
MGQILQGSATATHAIRATIQRSKAPIQEFARQRGLNRKTVRKWRGRDFFARRGDRAVGLGGQEDHLGGVPGRVATMVSARAPSLSLGGV